MAESKLPREADNYDVWCERCQRVHRHFTFTQEDEDRIVREGAKAIADAVNAEAIRRMMERFDA